MNKNNKGHTNTLFINQLYKKNRGNSSNLLRTYFL